MRIERAVALVVTEVSDRGAYRRIRETFCWSKAVSLGSVKNLIIVADTQVAGGFLETFRFLDRFTVLGKPLDAAPDLKEGQSRIQTKNLSPDFLRERV